MDVETTIVGMPAFTDPSNPDAAQGSINLPLEDHPVEHSEDYGESAQAGSVVLTADDGAVGGAVARDETYGQPSSDDRDEWKVADWKAQAAKYGLNVSGTKDELVERVYDYEASDEFDGGGN